MVTSMANEEKSGGSLNYGIMGGIDVIPKNFSVDFLLYYSDKGINKVCFKYSCNRKVVPIRPGFCDRVIRSQEHFAHQV